MARRESSASTLATIANVPQLPRDLVFANRYYFKRLKESVLDIKDGGCPNGLQKTRKVARPCLFSDSVAFRNVLLATHVVEWLMMHHGRLKHALSQSMKKTGSKLLQADIFQLKHGGIAATISRACEDTNLSA
jgi:hypothetical protein